MVEAVVDEVAAGVDDDGDAAVAAAPPSPNPAAAEVCPGSMDL